MTTSNDLTEIKGSIRQGWEEVAREYAKDRLGIFDRGAQRLLELLHPAENSSLLDVGCGNGAVALRTAEWIGHSGKVFGSDIAIAMLRSGQKAAAQEMFDVDFSQMDAECLGFASNSMDNVSCAFSLFQFPNMEMALDEMWRVLKMGGRLGLSNWGPGYFTPIAALQWDLFREFGIRPLLTNPLTFKPDQLNRLLYNSGFINIELYEETEEIWFESPDEVWAFDMDMGPFPVMLRQQLSNDRLSELLIQFKTMLDDLRTENGILSTFHLLFAVAEKGG
ncbi:MAG: methyltransferase domain-containing protein [Anaerolineales bacterium]|nr:methyltransferase domain-containing protein [Anaerolineales bacterium]